MTLPPLKADPLSLWLVRRWGTPPGEAPGPGEVRAAFGVLEGWVSIAMNTVLFAIKLAVGITTGSIALLADAAHTLSDSVTSAIVIAGARVSRRPPDAEHPFGHGRAEAIATLMIAVLLCVAGIEFGKASVGRVLHPSAVDAPLWAVASLLVAIAIKEWLSRFALALARASGNKSIEADFWHHRSDVLATALVVVGMVAADRGVLWLDGVMGLGVSVLLAKVGLDVVRDAIDALLGARPTQEEIRQVREQAMQVEGVRGVHDVVIHRYGESRFVSLHVETSDALSASDLHAISERVEEKVAPCGHGSVAVHADPVNTDHPAWAGLRLVIAQAVEATAGAKAFHDLRVVGDEERFNVVFDMTLDPSCADRAGVRERVAAEVQRAYPAARVVIEVDPLYSY